MSTVRQGTQSAQEKAIAPKKEWDPLAPAGSAVGLSQLLELKKDSLAKILPQHMSAERLLKTALVAANRNPVILQCTQASIMETVNRAAELGLDLSGTLGEAYMVPFKNKVKDANGNEFWAMQCTLIIGYRGLEKLAWQSQMVETLDSEVVCEKDRFVFRKGFEPVLEWEPCMTGDRGKPVGAYALIIIKGGGRMARFLTVGDIEKIRNGAQSKDSPAWRNHWNEMARKTAIRRVLKDAPLSTEKLIAALEEDDKDYQFTDVLSAETGEPNRGTAAVAKRIRGQVGHEVVAEDVGEAHPAPEAAPMPDPAPAPAPAPETTQTPADEAPGSDPSEFEPSNGWEACVKALAVKIGKPLDVAAVVAAKFLKGRNITEESLSGQDIDSEATMNAIDLINKHKNFAIYIPK